jgi:glycosyltransferase involved in cell wall biosynthesis
MRIFVVEPDGAGGMIHYAYQLCTALSGAGADVTLITSTDYELADLPAPFAVEPLLRLWPAIEPRPPERGRVGELTFGVYRRLRRAGRAIRLAIAWERLTRFVIRSRPDIVQFAIIRFPFQAFWLRRMERAGLTLTQICHEFEARESRFGGLRARLGRAAYRSFSAIFFHSEADRDRFVAVHGTPNAVTHIIPHGNETMFAHLVDAGAPDLRSRYGIGTDRPVALFFGGLRPSKGVDDLVEAFASVRDEIEACLLVVGHPTAGFPLGALRSRVIELGLGDDVVIDPHYLPLEEVGALLRTATVVALPYRTATASGALQVAYAFARPVVVTDTGGLPAAVDDGRTGLIVPRGDDRALARALVKLLSDPDLAASMGAAARRAAEDRYSWRPIAETILDVAGSLS